MQNTSQTIGPEAFITPGVVAHVESVARTIIAIYDFNREDFDDICHDFYLEILNYAGQYTPGLCSPETYACRRVDWYKKQVVKRLSERKRTMSFSEIMTDDDENEDDVIPFENETAENTVERLSLRCGKQQKRLTLPGDSMSSVSCFPFCVKNLRKQEFAKIFDFHITQRGPKKLYTLCEHLEQRNTRNNRK